MAQQLDQFLTIKPQVATVEMRDLKFHLNDDSASDVAELKVGGTVMNVVLSQEARRDIIKLSGLTPEAINTIKFTSGAKAADAIFRQAIKSFDRRQVTLAFDGPRITRVVNPKKKAESISNLKLGKIIELMQERGMEIWGLQISPDQTSATIQLVDPTVHEHPTQKNEEIQIGRSFHWDALQGTTIYDFVQRMFCANGMTRSQDGKVLQILQTDADPATLLDTLFLKDADKRANRYFEKISTLQNLRLSVREWQKFAKLLSPFSQDSEVFENHLGFPKLTNTWWELEYAKFGIKLEDLTLKQLANCPTPIIWWDAINCMTWLGSHFNESGASEWVQGQLLTEAGKFTSKKEFDAEGWMTGLPEF